MYFEPCLFGALTLCARGALLTPGTVWGERSKALPAWPLGYEGVCTPSPGQRGPLWVSLRLPWLRGSVQSLALPGTPERAFLRSPRAPTIQGSSGPGGAPSPRKETPTPSRGLGQDISCKSLSVAGRSGQSRLCLPRAGVASRPPDPPGSELTWQVNKSNPGGGGQNAHGTKACFLHLTVIRGGETCKSRRRFAGKGVWAGACE